MSRCNLCKQEKSLIKKSHIISKSLFRDLFVKEPKYHILQFDVINPKKKEKYLSDALYDSDIFCSSCDGDDKKNKLRGMGMFEDYFKKYILNQEYQTDNSKAIEWHIYQNYDFDKFYLFFQIHLFRAALSQRKEFETVTIDSEILESIRENIYSNKFFNKTNEIAILKLSDKSNFKNSIGSFRKVNENYWIILREYIVFFIFDNTLQKLNGHIIKPEATIIPVIPFEYEDIFLKSIIGL